MNDFLPENYEVPTGTSKYTKFELGENRIRILDRPIIGWQYWTNETKPVRLKDKPDTQPENIQVKNGKPTAIKHFWAFPIWNYKTKQIEICEITQATIQKAIESYAKDNEWGSPLLYDIKVVKIGEGLDTEYSVLAMPAKAIDAEIEKVWTATEVNLNAMYEGGDPFVKNGK